MTLELRLKRFWFLPDWIQTGNGEPRRAHIVGKNEPASVDKGTPGRDKCPQERNTGKYRPLANITLGEVDDAMRHFMPQMVPSPAEGWIACNYFCQLYWEDIGTIESFYQANLALTEQPVPSFSFYDEKAPIYTRSRYLPPTKLLDSRVIESMVGEGCILKECTVKRSVIGIRSRIETGCVIDNALIMGADFYESPAERQQALDSGKVPLGVGANTTIQRAIVDKNARIGRNVRIVNHDCVQEATREELGFVIRNGIVVVIKNATIPDGTVI